MHRGEKNPIKNKQQKVIHSSIAISEIFFLTTFTFMNMFKRGKESQVLICDSLFLHPQMVLKQKALLVSLDF